MEKVEGPASIVSAQEGSFRLTEGSAMEIILRYLNEVDRAKSPQRACALATTIIAEQTRYSRPAIFLYNPRTDSLELTAYANHNPTAERITRGKGVCWRSFASEEIQVVNDVTKDPDYFQDMLDTQAELSVPIVWHGSVFGVLDVESSQRDCFSDEDVRFARLLAGILGSVLSHVETETQFRKNLERGKMFRANLIKAQEALNRALEEANAQKGAVEEHARIQRALIDVSRTLFVCRDARQLYLLIMEILVRELGFPTVLVFGRDHREAPLSCQASLGIELDLEQESLLMGGSGIVGHVVKTLEPYLCSDTAQDPYFDPDDYGTRSELVVPIRSGDFLWGLVVAIARRPGAYTLRDLETLTLVAGFMSVVLENIANLDMLAREIKLMRFLHGMVHELSGERDNRSIALRIIALLREAFDDMLVTVFDVREEGGRMEIFPMASSGSMEEAEGLWRDVVLRPGRLFQSTVAQAATSRKVVSVPDTDQASGYVRGHSDTRSELNIPILHGERVRGVLCFESPRPRTFTQDDEELFVILARHLGALWAVNDLLDMTELKAMRDGLTGIWNRRFLFSYLEGDGEDLVRRGGTLTLVMVDLRRFKLINDTYGHAVGDEVLTTVAAFFYKRLEGVGFAGRYGGDEFLIVLPDKTLEEAERLVEELGQGVKELAFSVPELRTQANFGIASCPRDGVSIVEALRRADERMYEAKRRGT